jgi:hypothetical protein
LYLQNCDIIVPRVECVVIFMHDDFGDLVAFAAVHVHAARPDAHVLSRTAEKGKSREYKTSWTDSTDLVLLYLG